MRYLPVFLALLPALFGVPTLSYGAGKVIFFGGATAQKKVLDQCFPDFENYGYPAKGAVNSVVEEINANPNQPYTVVGHSSGALYADQVAMGKIKNPGRITLIDLDGYAPVGVPRTIKNRVCWHAAGGASGRLKSRNYSAMSGGNNCSEVKTYRDNHCSSVWCMHSRS